MLGGSWMSLLRSFFKLEEPQAQGRPLAMLCAGLVDGQCGPCRCISDPSNAVCLSRHGTGGASASLPNLGFSQQCFVYE